MSQFVNNLREQLIQVLSFSERTLRSSSAVLVGASTLLTTTLIPESLRQSTTYRVTLGMLQQFITEKIAEVELETKGEEFDVGDDFAQRKVFGTALEAAGILTVGFSPLWVFAIIGDGVGGSKLYLNKLVEQLKEDGLIDEKTEITEVSQMFEAIERASSNSAKAIDMPPLSQQDFSNLTNEMVDGYGDAFGKTSAVLPQLDTLWASMESLTKRENISMEKLMGIMTLDAMKQGAGVATSVGKASANLVDEKILESYRKTIQDASTVGVNSYISDHMRPFLEAAGAHFNASNETWIERTFKGQPKSDSSS
ncbi:MAG: hypothetical protein AAGD96_20825 [Chloroflexota bacterium]